MGSALDSLWVRATQKPDHPAKHKSTKQFNGFLIRWGEGRYRSPFNGAVHDKSDDKLNFIKYESSYSQ